LIYKFELIVAPTISLVTSSAMLIIRLGVVPVVVKPVSLETIWATSADAMVGLVLLLPTTGPPASVRRRHRAQYLRIFCFK
jgi:hypothetical protein